MIRPPQAVLDAVMAPVSNITRRIEVYESDGVTPWGDTEEVTGSLKDGAISVDSTRAERRSLDLALDNSLGTFTRDPRNGFWYDKVIKAYRGVEYTAFEQYGDLILGQRPGLFWRMDSSDTARDLSVHGVHGARLGWPVATQPLVDAPDAMGSVRFADDSSCFVSPQLGVNHPARNFTTWTLEAWVRPIGYSPASAGLVFGRDAIDCRMQVTSDLKVQALVRDGNGVLTVATTDWFLTPGRIYHLTATCNGSFVSLYVNGELQDQQPFSGLGVQLGNGFAAGNDSTGTRQFRGDIDECAYYSRALDRNEIAQHLQAGRGRREVKHSWEAQIGEFMIDQINESRFPRETKVTGRDYTKRCLQAKLPTAMTFPTDTKLEDFVRAMAANAGVKKFLLPTTGVTIGSATDFDQGTERWNVMKKACEASAYDLYFTPDGYLTMRQQLDPSTSAVGLRFETGAKGNLVDWSKSSTDTEIFNRIICVSEGGEADALPFYGEASNTEPTSPTNIARLGERTFIYPSQFFTSNAQAAETARAMLKVKALESFNVDFSSLVFPWTEAGEIIEFIDPDAADYDPTRFLLSSFSIPLKLGPMTATAKRIIIVGELPASEPEFVPEDVEFEVP